MHRLSSMSSTSVASPRPWLTRKLTRLPASGSASRRAFCARRSSTRASMLARSSGLRASACEKRAGCRTIVSVATAARTVAVRRESESSAISPT